MTNNKICPYGDEVWVNPNNHNQRSLEYVEGFFKRIYCVPGDKYCAFEKDFTDCALWEKKERE